MLRISEIFYSLQGETSTVGLPTVFVRLTGCPLRCQYCDTAYAFSGGTKMSQAEILENVAQYKAQYVTVTGGEPLAQKACLPLLSALCDQDYQVSLETSGAIDVSQVDSRVIKILDLKTPASNEADKNLYDNIKYLNPHDQIKFVICNRDDYVWSKEKIKEYHLANKFEVLFSPSHEELAVKDLAQWILEDHLPVRLQIQLHKYIWGNEQGR
jgi:7-carboxy-7-deazaguanine synthase